VPVYKGRLARRLGAIIRGFIRRNSTPGSTRREYELTRSIDLDELIGNESARAARRRDKRLISGNDEGETPAPRSVKEAISQASKSAIALACYDRRRIDALSSREIGFLTFREYVQARNFGRQPRIKANAIRARSPPMIVVAMIVIIRFPSYQPERHTRQGNS